MVEKWDITIPKLSGNVARSAYIYLPESYAKKKDRRYPVLYMFDGHNVFFDADATYGKCWGMKEYMDSSKTQLIIVAVECSHDPDNGRLKEYSPFYFYEPRCGQINGRGQLTMEWLVRTLKPFIDRSYRTLPDRSHTFIAGSSMGGLMSVYALLEYNAIFSRAAALSPSLWVNPKALENLLRRSAPKPDTVLYMDYGTREIGNHPRMYPVLARTASLLLEKQILLNFRIIPNGEHNEASWEKQIPFFMHALTYGMEKITNPDG